MKRLLSVIVALALCFSSLPICASAATPEAVEAADRLYSLGLFRGTGTNPDGTPIYSLDAVPTRNQAVIMLVRLLGKEEEALAGEWDLPFTDVPKGSTTYPYIGYAYANGLTNGTTTTTYSGKNPIRANQYATFVLRALGYTSGVDFKVSEALTFSDRIGLTDGRYSSNSYFTRGDVAIISSSALDCYIAGTTTPLMNIVGSRTIAKISDAVEPLGVLRSFPEIEAVDGVEPYGAYWAAGSNKITADLSDSTALAYSLTVSDTTTFSELPAGYDPDALIEWGKYPGLNMDILHKYGFTGEGAVVAYVDQAFAAHEQYSEADINYINNSNSSNTMHGPMVLSLLVGKDTGTAPDAEVYYYAFQGGQGDQLNEAACLYQIIEKNKALPDGEKITMVGFSDNIDYTASYAEEFEDAVVACEEAGIMVWFCGEYSTAAFLPLSDKNNPANLTYNPLYCNRNPQLVFVPASGRTGAAAGFGASYIYWGGGGGVSWTMPYVLGLYAIAIEIDPALTANDLRELIVDTAYDNNGMKIVNPVGFVAEVLNGVGRNSEAQQMLNEVAARTKYLYAIMDTAAMSEDDLKAVGEYLATITDATVLVADAVGFSNTEDLYADLQADAAARGGEIVGVQIFGTADMVPAFQVRYKVQMPTAVDDSGIFLTDLFYGNFDNNPAVISNGYNVMDHFAEGWNVELTPDWPVARLPLLKGEYAAFFEKYSIFIAETGLERQDLVSFSNPIFPSSYHIDDMSLFLNRMNSEFGLLDADYRLYGNQMGQYPVTTAVIGGFTADNLAAENEAGIAEFLINSHGQWNNIDKCYFENGEEIRESLINMDTINNVLDDNPYYLDCWTCLNGYGMGNNLTTTALNGSCVGMFSATAIISNNGVNCRANVSEMAESNFYYFYYHYLKALNEGRTRSDAFCVAQQEYASALLADSANGIGTGEGNYQFNLCNLLAYHNFGVLEPNPASAAFAASGYISQAGQSVPKVQSQLQNYQGGQQNGVVLTDGTAVGQAKDVQWSQNNQLLTGTITVHSLTVQALDNGYMRFNLEFTARAGMPYCIFSPPDGELFKLTGGPTTGERQEVIFDLNIDDIQTSGIITIRFNFDNEDSAFLFVQSSSLI